MAGEATMEKVEDADLAELNATEVAEELEFRSFIDFLDAGDAIHLFESSLDNVADAIFVIAADARFLYVNGAACRMLAYLREELLVMTIHDIDIIFGCEIWNTFWKDLLVSRHQKLVSKQRDKGGGIIDVEIVVTCHDIHGTDYAFASVRDISDRIKTEHVLMINAERAKALLELSHMRLASAYEVSEYALDVALTLTGSTIGYVGLVSYNESVITMQHWSKAAMEECAIQEKPIIYPVEKTGLWGEAVRQRRAIITNDYAAPSPCKKGTPEGHVRLLRTLNVPVFDEDHIVAVIGVANKEADYTEEDVTQLRLLMDGVWRIVKRKEAEEALRKSEERFKLAIMGSGAGLFDWDIASDKFFVSPQFKEIYDMEDLTENDSLGHYLHYIHAEDYAAFMACLNNHIERRTPFNVQYRSCFENGECRWFQASGQALWDSRGTAYRMAGSIIDITEQKRAEESKKIFELKIQNTQMLESIGQLAAGIAHEINTPMQYVGDNTRFLRDSFSELMDVIELWEKRYSSCTIGAASACAEELEAMMRKADFPYLKEEIPRAIDQTLEGIDRVRKIVLAMKDFSHPDTGEKALVDINRCIETTITVARNEWKYVAELETDLEPDLPLLPCVTGSINQVLLNLVVNAAQAIAEKVGPNPAEKGLIKICTKKSEEWIEVKVGDSGMGIPEAIRNRIFDPFFTTKPVGKGTGQGLALAYNIIVRQHGGTIDYESRESIGTTFVIRMPLKEVR
jgi:PAS domain S-box-containing protein